MRWPDAQSEMLLTGPADGYSLAVLIGDTYALLAGPHPAFNADRGPVDVFGARVHAEF